MPVQVRFKHEVLFRVDVSEPTEPKSPRVLAHFNFNGESVMDLADRSAECEVQHSMFDGGAYQSNGVDETSDEAEPQRLMISTPRLNYRSFTVAMRYQPQSTDRAKSNILSAGKDDHWFGLSRSNAGNLSIAMNNVNVAELKEFPMRTNEWYDIVCAVDLNQGIIGVTVNEKPVKVITLPNNFQLKVASLPRNDLEKKWSFSDHRNHRTLLGLVDEFTIFDGVFSKEEFTDVRASLEH